MKNRVKLLCIKKGITTPELFALKTGLGVMKATRIWNEEEVLDFQTIDHLARYFEVSVAYLLCQCEKEN